MEHFIGDFVVYQKFIGIYFPDTNTPGIAPLLSTMCAIHWFNILVLVSLYGHIIAISLNHSRRVMHQTSNETEDTENIFSRLKRNFRIIRTPFIVTFLFFCSYLPSTFIGVYYVVTGIAPDPGLQTASIALLFTNGCFNPFVYYLTIISFRETAKKMLKCC